MPEYTPSRRPSRRTIIALLAVAALVVVAAVVYLQRPEPAPTAAPEPLAVRIIGMNDLHGNLQPPTGSSGRVQDGDAAVEAGGAAFLATHIARLRAEAPRAVLVSAGDNIGGSPAVSALFHDEPTIDLLDQLGVAASVVGNHEFDEGVTELRRMQDGGCHPTDGCRFRPDFGGAAFPYLGANVTDDAGRPVLPASTVVDAGGVRIGVIGVTLRELPTIVTAEVTRGLRFGDEIAAIDAASAELTAQGVNAQIVLLHQGDQGSRDPSSCPTELAGAGAAIARGVSPAVDAVFGGHTHQQYVCSLPDPAGVPRPYLQGLSFGRLLSVVDLAVDPATGEVRRDRTAARNHPVTRDVPADPAAAALVDEAVTDVAPIADAPAGTITADLLAAGGPSGESALGDVIADAQLAATRPSGAQVAVTNPGGIRADLPFAPDGVVTYGEAFTVQPFGNVMQTVTLTGAQLDALLEQQWQESGPRILQVSASLRYTWSDAAPVGEKVSAITVDGAPVDPAAAYRVGVNNFLAAGGDGFTVLTQATDVTGGPVDLDALLTYLAANPSLSPPALDRITRGP